MIIFRYLCKEVFSTVLVVLLILLFIFITHDAVHYLNRAADGEMMLSVMLQLMFLQIPVLMAYLLPMSLFFALLLTLGRWGTEQEIVALMAAGLSRSQLISMVLLLASIVGVAVGFLILYVEPQLQRSRVTLLTQAMIENTLAKMTPGRFAPLGRSDRIFYASDVDAEHKKMRFIFLAQPKGRLPAEFKWTVVLAKGASDFISRDGQRFVLFQQGEMNEGVPGQASFSRTRFAQYAIPLSMPLSHFKNKLNATSTYALWFSRKKNLKYMAELQWRFSIPLSVWLLALLSLPLSQQAHRKTGKFAPLLPAILIYFVYVDLIFAGRAWIEQGQLNPNMGLWWVHGFLLCVSLSLLFLQSMPIRIHRYFLRIRL